MTLQYAKLTLDADVDGDGTVESGVFELAGDVSIDLGVRTNFVVNGLGATINSIFSETVGDGESKRQGLWIDLGGGVEEYTISFNGWEGSSRQWGDGTSNAAADATGEDPMTQVSVLQKYLIVGEFDSRGAATLEWGEFSSSGEYSPIDVVIEDPSLSVDFSEGESRSTFDGSITCLSAADLTSSTDGTKRTVE